MQGHDQFGVLLVGGGGHQLWLGGGIKQNLLLLQRLICLQLVLDALDLRP